LILNASSWPIHLPTCDIRLALRTSSRNHPSVSAASRSCAPRPHGNGILACLWISMEHRMKRRHFLELTGTAVAAALSGACGGLSHLQRADTAPSGAAWFRSARRFANLSCGNIAYVDRGSGRAALFLHGAPLNSYQWRGAIDRLSADRRCIAPDFMGLGYSEVPKGQSLAAADQAEMLTSLLDQLAIAAVDIVASDSGGAVAQLFVARYPRRVRTMLLTNCDVEPDSPPAKVKPAIEMARAGTLADVTAQWLIDKSLARATFGAAVFRDPAAFAD
jgi:hypothetical protein